MQEVSGSIPLGSTIIQAMTDASPDSLRQIDVPIV